MLKGNAMVAQSGGPTAAINATLAGVINAAMQHRHIKTLYGAHHGIVGVIDDDVYNLTAKALKPADLTLLASTPAAVLGSCRHKLPEFGTSEEYEEVLSTFKKYNIRYFFYIGGNDSMDAVVKLDKYMRQEGWEVNIIGIPKTIDNDLMHTHHTPGYGSAAKYVATVTQEILRDSAVYAVPAVTIIEVMGRDAGWLTAATALPGMNGVAPDYIYLPEVPFELEYCVRDVENALAHHPNVVIALSEGVRSPSGAYLSDSGFVDAFGHKSLSGAGKAVERAIKEQIGCKTRVIELNVPQRCASHCASQHDWNEAILLGEAAVRFATSGESGKMVAIGDTFHCVQAEAVANQVRYVPRAFINAAGNHVTDECVQYILPLIQGEAKVYWHDGLPKHFSLN